MSKAALTHLHKVDKTLSKLIRQVGPCELKFTQELSPFEYLLRAIAYQQLTGKAAATIFGRVQALYVKPSRKQSKTPGAKLRFPRPQEILDTPEEKLRAAGLSFAKIRAAKSLAQFAVEGKLPTAKQILKLGDDEIIERLTQVRGIGPWTVQMMLMFKLGRLDVMPNTDYGVRKGFALLYKHKELPAPKKLLEYAELWKPYRSVAAWYMWRAIEVHAPKLKAAAKSKSAAKSKKAIKNKS